MTEAQVWYVLIALTVVAVMAVIAFIRPEPYDGWSDGAYNPRYDPYCMRPGHDCGVKDAGPCNGLPRHKETMP